MLGDFQEIIKQALAEDIGPGDLTTWAVVAPDTPACARILAKEAGIVAGLPVAARVFASLDTDVRFSPQIRDGAKVSRGDTLALVEGRAETLLSGERVALNFLRHLSGIATRTAGLVQAVASYRARIVDTRKTTPGLRVLEKYAVRVGGGHNHRFALYDGVLIKENHIRVAGGIGQAVSLARVRVPHTLKIEVEVTNRRELDEALETGADIILLDNMSPDEMREAVEVVNGRCLLEASGGITEETVVAVAKTGVDLISVGALTHSVRALDISMDIEILTPPV
ncbi:MAG: carboxylating nicotinate-nucleotide diphosphorylase [Desulforudis sp.]|jgi:nicotinate-nucleotide pyrophosphorylase (carboxylating)|nr:MAG: carboxylating nicotinate-nucleotide diphosphorylase [Desulforudis sp.]